MGVFSGDTFCVSGAFSISQNDMRELVIKNGAHIATTPNKSCTYLVADSIGSSKTMKAEKDGIPIVTEEWVQKSIKAGKKSTDASLFLSGGPSSGGKSKAVAKSAGGAKKKSKQVESEEEEEEEEVKPKKKAPAKKAGASGSVFSGEVFCVSGSFTISQAEMRKLIITNGGDVVDTPNKKCTYLVADSIGSSKTVKAQKDGIKIVTEEWVNESIAKGKKSTEKKFFLSSGDDGGDDMDEDDESKPAKKKKPSAKRKSKASDDEEEEDGPKKKKANTALAKSILWIDPNNLANNKEHLDAVGIDRVESVGSQDEAITWFKNEQKNRPKILTQIKIVSNMARMEGGVFQPQAGIATTIKLNQMGVPFENILVYTSQERAKGKFPPNVRITYDDAELTKFLASASTAQVNADDNEKDEDEVEDVEHGGENGGSDEDDDEDDEGGDDFEPDPESIPGSIKVNWIDPSLLLNDASVDVLYTNYKPAAVGAPLARYRTLIINKVRDPDTLGAPTKRVYLFDARPENHASIQLIEDGFAALLKLNQSMEDPENDAEENGKYSTTGEKFPYAWVQSLDWSPNEQTQAEVFATLKEEEYLHVVIVNNELNHAALKKQLSSEPHSIDSVVFAHLLDYVHPDSIVHSPSFIPKVNDKLYHMAFWQFDWNAYNFLLLDARPSNLKAIERLRKAMGKPWTWTENGYAGCWFTQPGAPMSEGALREIILRQRITAEYTNIDFYIGQFRTAALFSDISEAKDEDSTEGIFSLVLEDISSFQHEDDESVAKLKAALADQLNNAQITN